MNWPQLKTILWLRWRLTRNQWAKSGGIGAALAAIVGVMAVTVGVLGLAGGALVGVSARNFHPLSVMGFWVGLTVIFLFFWLIGLLNELQRSETIDLQRLMHLPVQLGQIFGVNYVASHLSFSIAVVVPTMMGLAIGLAFSRGPAMLLMIPLALSMIFMISAWTYYVRGWLAAMMSNPRKRRAVIMALSFGVLLLIQAPNLYFNVFRRHDGSSSGRRSEQTAEQRAARDAENQRQLNILVTAEKVVPPLWVGAGAKGLAEGTPWPALAGMLGCIGIGALGLRLAYTSTVRFYQGTTGGKASARAPSTPAAAPTSKTRSDRVPLVERRIPFVPDESSAMAVATLRSMLRAPEIKMQWGVSFLILIVVGSSLLFRTIPKVSPAFQPFAATAGVIFSLFFMVQFLTNQFGFDREGFRAFVLSPVDRKLILIGKNVATLPAPIFTSLLLLVIISIWTQLSPLHFIATLFQLIGGVLVLAIGGNLMSILVPFRIQPGSMKATKMPGLNVFLIVIAQFLFPVAMSPLFLGPLVGYVWERANGTPAALISLLLSAMIAAVMAALYWGSMGPLGRLLQNRETKILQTVTAEVE